jgi:hypothetical protein
MHILEQREKIRIFFLITWQVEAQNENETYFLKMINDNQIGTETPATQDMLLYIFTGVFFLFTFDTFVNLGRRLK